MKVEFVVEDGNARVEVDLRELQNTLTRLDEELGKLKQKVEDTNKLMADLKDKLLTIWAK